MKKYLAVTLLLFPSLALAGPISAVCHSELSAWIKAGKSISIVDVQKDEEFRERHYDESIATGNETARLKRVSHRLRSAKGKVIVVSTTGGEDALQAAEQLVLGGVQRSRILLLEGGIEAAAKNVACECCVPASVKGVPE